MELLMQWLEDGYIDSDQYKSLESLLAEEKDQSYNNGYDSTMADFDSGYEAGWDDCYNAAKAELEEKMKDEWFQQGWEEALIEHGIEE